MRTINLRESLIRIDQETDFKYTLTDLYEACQLDEKKKAQLAQYIDAKDPVGMNAMLSNEAGVMTENVSDDIPDDQMPELEGWSPDMSECPACGDFTFNSKRGRCNACSYVEELTESFSEGDMVWVKPSNKPGRVVSVKGDTVEVEIQGGKDPDRRDTFYASDLEMEDKMQESGALVALGAAAATGFGQAVGDKVATKILGEDAEELDFSCYNLTDDQIEKVKYIRQHLDTPEGYKAYYELEKEITDEGGCMDIFYDLSADFAWDNRFSVALTKLALADNRPDLADPEYLPGGAYAEYMDDPKYVNVLLEDVTGPDLESTLRAAAEPKLREMDYDDEFIDEFFGINIEDTEDNRIKVTVWGELYYEELDELADVLNHIVAEEDPDAYFDHETSGRIVAYIRKDQSEDIPDEALVAEWSEKFNSCSTWEQLKDVYGEFYNIRDDLNNGTHRALYDIIDKKIDELKPVKESLTEDAEEAPAAIYSMLDAADKYVDNDEYPEGASEEEIIEIAKNNPDCMKVTKWIDGQTGPDEVVWERPVDTWFVCQYEGGAEYEHAEGGYYYETLALVDKETFPSKEAAQKRLAELAAEAEKEGEEVVALTNDFFRIKTGKYIGDCEEYHVEAKEGAHASGKQVYEGLNESILREMNSPEDKPYSTAEVEKEIKSLTQNFTRKKDNLKCGFKEENDAAVKLLKKHYNKVTSEKRGQWFEITFTEPKKELKEASAVATRPSIATVLSKNMDKFTSYTSPSELKFAMLDTVKNSDVDPKEIKKFEIAISSKKSVSALLSTLATYATGIKVSDKDNWREVKSEALTEGVNEPVKLSSEYFYDTIKNIQDAGWSEILSFAEDSGWISGSNIIIPAGTVMTLVDQNRYYDVYWVKTSAGDEFIPFNKDFTAESPLSFESTEGLNNYRVTFYMDSLDDNVMSGPSTTKMIRASSEEEAKKKLIDSSTDKYYIPTVTKVELVEDVKLREGTKQKRIACTTEFDNGNVIHNDWQEISDEEAEELAKQHSIENPDKVYYVKYDDIMNPCSDYKWKNGQRINESDETSKEWEHKDKEGRIGRIRQSDGKGDRKSLTRDQAREIAEFRGHGDDELYPVNESKSINEDLSSITSLADDCGKNTFTKSARDVRFTFEDEQSASKFMNKLKEKNIHYDELPRGIIKVSKSSVLDESGFKSIDEILDSLGGSDDLIIELAKIVHEYPGIEDDSAELANIIYPNYKNVVSVEELKSAVEYVIEDVLNESTAMTADEMKDKYGTDNPDIINAGKPEEERVALKEQMTYTDTNGFLGEPGEQYTMSQFRRMWQDKDNDPVMSGYDSFEEWVGETISQMDAHEEEPEVVPSGRGKLSTAIFIDTNGVMGTIGGKFTVNDLADYWEANRGSDPVLANYNGDWKRWLDDTIEQMEIEYDSCLFEESLSPEEFEIQNYKDVLNDLKNLKLNPNNFNESIQFRYMHVIVTFTRLSEETINVSIYRPGGIYSWMQSSSLEWLIEWTIKNIKQHGPYEIRHIQEGLESKTFTDKEEAKKFAKDNKGAITSVVDDKLNPTHYVHYKGKKAPIKESKSELDRLNTILAAQGDELRRLKKDGAAQSEIDKIIKDIEDTKKKIGALCESFEDMLKDPEVQRRNAEYADRMKAKHDKENELAKEAKNWPDDKELTYEEALALAKAYYNQGGDSFYETIEKYQFDDEVSMFGPMTVKQMKRDFGVFDSVARDRMGDDVL